MSLPSPAEKYDLRDQSETRRLTDVELQRLNSNVLQLQQRGAGIATKTANYSLSPYDETILVDATAGPITITYPTPSTVSGKEYVVKKIDASVNAVTLQATIDGAVNPTLTAQYQSKRAQSSGAAYFAV